jgi:divalent metal cation (Fe/Co/Zn/Cd) transporter
VCHLFFVIYLSRVVLIVVLGGIGIGLSSLDALVATLPPDTFPAVIEELIHAGHVHGHSHGPAVGADPMALWVAGGSIGIKEWLFRASIYHHPSTLMLAKKVALQTNSTVLLANVFCFRTELTVGLASSD